MSNYYLISVPVDNGSQQRKMKDDLEKKIIESGDTETKLWEFDIPKEHFRAGNIDSLIYLSDALKKSMIGVEGTLRKVTTQLLDLFERVKEEKRKKATEETDKKRKVDEKEKKKNEKEERSSLRVNGAKPDEALTRFKWDESRFSGRKKTLADLVQVLKGEVLKAEKSMRERGVEYSTLCQKVDQIAANESGNLLTRDINAVIKEYNSKRPEGTPAFKPVEERISKETQGLIADYNNNVPPNQHFGLTLTTLYVIVPKNEQKNWVKSYETILDAEKLHFVVPCSSEKLAEDSDSVMNSVIVFNKDIEEFKAACRARRYTVRKNDPTSVIPESEKMVLFQTKAKIQAQFLRESENNFTDIFTCWLHLKCIQCYVESLLRYGPIPDFVVILILPKKGQEKKLIKFLIKYYGYLGDDYNDREDEALPVTDDKIGGQNEKYFPFVHLEINLGLAE